MSLPSPNSKPIGVLFAPFQTPTLLDTHRSALAKLIQNHAIVVVALPVSRITPSKVSPLDFRTRQAMIHTLFPNVLVVPVPHRKYGEDKAKALEEAIRAPFSEFRGATIYMSEADVSAYRPHCTMDLFDMGWDFYVPEHSARIATRDAVVNDEDFRRGIIHALTNQFQISWSTVDMFIRRVVDKETYVLLGKKPGERGWRFPGGFKDRTDLTYEAAVYREAGEEILKPEVDPSVVFTYPEYIGSRNIDDWRYKKEIDGITTLFYAVKFIGTDDQIKAGDDLDQAQWFELSKVRSEEMEGEHVHLLALAQAYEEMRNG